MHAIDRAALIQQVFQGRYHLAQSILPLGTLGYNPGVRPLTYDPARARALLAEAGYPRGAGLPPVTIWAGARTDRLLEEHARIVKSLADVGIRATYQYQTDWPAFSRLLIDGKAPMFMYSWNADMPGSASLKIEARAIYPGHSTKYYVMGLWSRDPSRHPRESVPHQKDDDGDVSTDTLILEQSCERLQLRLTSGGDADQKPKLKFVGISLADTVRLLLRKALDRES